MFLFSLLETLLFGYLTLSVGYLFLFTIASFLPLKEKKRQLDKEFKNRFAILIPAYREDAVIAESTQSVVAQSYSQELFKLYVIADQMREETLHSLRERGIAVSFPEAGDSSKANALKSVARSLPDSYDFVVILDADNVIPPHYLEEVNEYINQNNPIALQTHRQAKNLTTPTAVLDAAIEEMNNTIFRLGHIRLGLSSALIGSGMVFDHQWFVKQVEQLHSTGEDKELEELLLRERITIHYAEKITFADEKVEQPENLSNQRRRWLATQFMLASMMSKQLPKALLSGNVDYLVKAFQSILPPRSLLMGSIALGLCLTLLITPTQAIKWVLLLAILAFTLYLAVPKYMKTTPFYQALKQIPLFIGMMLLNLFKLKGASKKFIHTKHG